MPVLLNVAVYGQDYKIQEDLLEFKGKDVEKGTHLDTKITKSSEVPTVKIFRCLYFTFNTSLI